MYGNLINNSQNDANSSLNDWILYIKSLDTLEKNRKINQFSTIVFTIVGLLGHFLTIFVFVQRRFRKNSSNVFLLCLAINDSFYLITHFCEKTIRTLIYEGNRNNQTEVGKYLSYLNLIDSNDFTCKSINYLRYN
jgi:hypothetical protein